MSVVLAMFAVNGCGGGASVRSADPTAQNEQHDLERMWAAAMEFERAQTVGDSLGMARAAAARTRIDRVPGTEAGSGEGGGFLTARAMFAASRAMARGEPQQLEEIDRIESESFGGLSGRLYGFSAGARSPQPAQRPIDEAESLGGDDQRDRRNRILGLAPLPAAGAVMTVGSGKRILWRASVAGQRTLFVYAESKGGNSVRLRIIDGSSGEQVCVDAQSHGFLLCRWRAEKPAQAVVELSNAGERATAVLLIAHQ